ncbi:MAG: PDZ domain-containing protein [Candidatus Sulfotelmatobacter sp.]
MKEIKLSSLLATILFAVASPAQTVVVASPAEPGMYVEVSGGLSKVIGQIAEFKRSGSLFVNDVTIGIKARKENIQLLGAHAETVVSAQPVFYFMPAKQEAEAGVNGGDLILIRLEEKPQRRQFEIAAQGAWRSSSGISLTHQIQLLREEVNPGVYRLMPATELGQGEYALYLSRGEGMAAFVYDFGVQPMHLPSPRITDLPSSRSPDIRAFDVSKTVTTSSASESSSHASLGVFFEGNPDVRHDGVAITAVKADGPADRAGIKADDVILAIDDVYLFTVGELTHQVSRLQPGTKTVIRYRRRATISEASVTVGTIQ